MTEFKAHLEEIARTLRSSKPTKSVFKSFRFVRATEYEAAFSEYLQFRNDNPGLFELPGIICEPAQSENMKDAGFKWSFETEIEGYEIGVECTLENNQACMAVLLRDELIGAGIKSRIRDSTGFCCLCVHGIAHESIMIECNDDGLFSTFHMGYSSPLKMSIETIASAIKETAANFAAQKK